MNELLCFYTNFVRNIGGDKMKKQTKVLVGIIVTMTIILTGVIGHSIAKQDSQQDMKFFEEIIFSSLENDVNAFASVDCQESIDKIMTRHWDKAARKEMSYYGAGLILGSIYIEQDCDTAEQVIDEVLMDLWNGYRETKQHKSIVDNISAGLRFAKSTLP